MAVPALSLSDLFSSIMFLLISVTFVIFTIFLIKGRKPWKEYRGHTLPVACLFMIYIINQSCISCTCFLAYPHLRTAYLCKKGIMFTMYTCVRHMQTPTRLASKNKLEHLSTKSHTTPERSFFLRGLWLSRTGAPLAVPVLWR